MLYTSLWQASGKQSYVSGRHERLRDCWSRLLPSSHPLPMNDSLSREVQVKNCITVLFLWTLCTECTIVQCNLLVYGVERGILWWLYIFKATRYKQLKKKRSAQRSEWDNYRIIGEKMSGKQHSAPPYLLHCCCCCCCAFIKNHTIELYSFLHCIYSPIWYTAMPSFLCFIALLWTYCALSLSLSLCKVGGCLLVYRLLLIFKTSVYFNSCPVRGQISQDVTCKQWQWCSNTVLWVI